MKRTMYLVFFAFFLALCGSCQSEAYDEGGIIPPLSEDIRIDLLINGASFNSATKALSENLENSFNNSLKMLILKKASDDIYYYADVRTVEKNDDKYSIFLPESLDGADLKLFLLANSEDILGDADAKFVEYVGGKRIGKDEAYIRSALTLETTQAWPVGVAPMLLPMWSEKSIRFIKGVTRNLGEMYLLRMVARVDIGLNYNGSELASSAQGLSNFRMIDVRVHNTRNHGILIPDTENYADGATGPVVSVPTLPSSNGQIDRYIKPVAADQNSLEREIYMFEHSATEHADIRTFSVDRHCLILQGEYTNTDGNKSIGFYRIDFVENAVPGEAPTFKHVLRNMLFRFNIKEVKGKGFNTEEDALNSTASNITVELIPMDLSQNDIVFDGQSFLSVSQSRLLFYRDKVSASLNLTTNYPHGWKIEELPAEIESVTPNIGSSGSAVINVTKKAASKWPVVTPIFVRIRAGNLVKRIELIYLDENAPGALTEFSVTPFLYFVKSGGTGIIDVKTNISKKVISATDGELKITLDEEVVSGSSFPVTVSAYNGSAARPEAKGSVTTSIHAINASLAAETAINQLTYDKFVTITNTMIPSASADSNDPSVVIPYISEEARDGGNYHLFYSPVNDVDVRAFDQVLTDATGNITVSAPVNFGAARDVATLKFVPRVNGITLSNPLSLIGFDEPVFTIRQAEVGEPSFSLSPSELTLDWNVVNGTVRIQNPLLVEKGYTISYSAEGSFDQVNLINPPSNLSQSVTEIPLSLKRNRGNKELKTRMSVTGLGYLSKTYTASSIVTQKNAPAPTWANPETTISLPWDASTYTHVIQGMKNVDDVIVASRPDNTSLFSSEVPERYDLDGAKSRASLQLDIARNTSPNERVSKFDVRVIGNDSVSKTGLHRLVFTQSGAPNVGITASPDFHTISWDTRSVSSTITAAMLPTRDLKPGTKITYRVLTGSSLQNLSFTPADGIENNGRLQISFDANYSSRSRSADIEVSAQGINGVVQSMVIPITQNAGEDPSARFEFFGSSTLPFSQSTQNYQVRLHTKHVKTVKNIGASEGFENFKNMPDFGTVDGYTTRNFEVPTNRTTQVLSYQARFEVTYLTGATETLVFTARSTPAPDVKLVGEYTYQWDQVGTSYTILRPTLAAGSGPIDWTKDQQSSSSQDGDFRVEFHPSRYSDGPRFHVYDNGKNTSSTSRVSYATVSVKGWNGRVVQQRIKITQHGMPQPQIGNFRYNEMLISYRGGYVSTYVNGLPSENVLSSVKNVTVKAKVFRSNGFSSNSFNAHVRKNDNKFAPLNADQGIVDLSLINGGDIVMNAWGAGRGGALTTRIQTGYVELYFFNLNGDLIETRAVPIIYKGYWE